MSRLIRISIALFLFGSFYNCRSMEFKKRDSLVQITPEYRIIQRPIKPDFQQDGQRFLKYARTGVVTCIFATGAHWTARHIDQGNLIRVLVGLGVTWKAGSYLFGTDK